MTEDKFKHIIKVRVRYLENKKEDGSTSRSVSAFFNTTELPKLIAKLTELANCPKGLHIYFNEGASQFNDEISFSGSVNVREHVPPVGGNKFSNKKAPLRQE